VKRPPAGPPGFDVTDLDVVRHPRARRVKLSLDPVTGRARLTLPARASRAAALEWAAGQGAWLAEQRARVAPPRSFAPGLSVDMADDTLVLDHRPGTRRTPYRDADRLVFEGPLDTLPRRAEAWLRARALDLLSAETAEFAAAAGVSVARVAVGDPRGRWGSCAAAGAVRYSWRLVLAPGWVRRSVVAHEVAHRVHMNHSPAFWTLTERLLGADPAPARAWLRANGATLHALGRSSGPE